jgi:mono/diheme cytochrome c family protein
MRTWHLLAFSGVALQLVGLLQAQPTPRIDFVRQIQPILQQRCVGCHGPKLQSANLRLDLHDSAKRVILPGHAKTSRIMAMVRGAEGEIMPPVGEKLTDAQVALIEKWIDQGAEWPASADAVKHWAWEPIRRPAVPTVKTVVPAATDIDRFILARLEKEGIAPSPEADKTTLLRRAALDITGLPPTPQETAAFLADNRSDAYARQVDRLIASPHYGEKWARPWLDMAHYADSDGFEKDLVRPWSWRYRDWVIDAYNRDLPYDKFVTLQIAGDELPDASTQDRIATGFYRNTMTNREAGVDRKEARFDQLIDRTGTTATVFLGLTVRCAQCHDHKYDPVTQKDFYRLFAYFSAADEIDIDAPLGGELGSYLRAKPEYEKKRAELMSQYQVAEHQRQWEQDMLENMEHPGRFLDWDFQVTEIRAGFDHAERVLRTAPEKRSVYDARRLTYRLIRSPGPRIGADKALSAKFKELKEKLDALDKDFPAMSMAYTMEDRPEYPAAYLAIRGDWKNPGDEVQPGTPGFLTSGQTKGRSRLDLARWILAPENPLTARVAANRVWQELFGRGIVSTSDDFGTQGDRPSHPELLDYLATEYRRLEWSQKALIREIVLSRTYRQASQSRPDLEQKDPENILLARQSRVRLPAELIRDNALATSGLLDGDIGGPSIRPFQPVGVAELGYSVKKWNESPGREKYRRGLYIHYQRTTPYPFLVNFDAPDSTLACTRRRQSDTALQSLNLLNDPAFFEAAQALAARLELETPSDFRTRLNRAFQLVVNRAPTERETTRLATYYDAQSGNNPWVGISRILLNLDEFITRE